MGQLMVLTIKSVGSIWLSYSIREFSSQIWVKDITPNGKTSTLM